MAEEITNKENMLISKTLNTKKKTSKHASDNIEIPRLFVSDSIANLLSIREWFVECALPIAYHRHCRWWRKKIEIHISGNLTTVYADLNRTKIKQIDIN